MTTTCKKLNDDTVYKFKILSYEATAKTFLIFLAKPLRLNKVYEYKFIMDEKIDDQERLSQIARYIAEKCMKYDEYQDCICMDVEEYEMNKKKFDKIEPIKMISAQKNKRVSFVYRF